MGTSPKGVVEVDTEVKTSVPRVGNERECGERGRLKVQDASELSRTDDAFAWCESNVGTKEVCRGLWWKRVSLVVAVRDGEQLT